MIQFPKKYKIYYYNTYVLHNTYEHISVTMVAHMAKHASRDGISWYDAISGEDGHCPEQYNQTTKTGCWQAMIMKITLKFTFYVSPKSELYMYFVLYIRRHWRIIYKKLYS